MLPPHIDKTCFIGSLFQINKQTLLAIQACRRYLSLDPANEPVCRTAMELLWQEGQKHQALSLYQELAAYMAKEFNGAPSSETNQLHEKISAGNPPPPAAASV